MIWLVLVLAAALFIGLSVWMHCDSPSPGELPDSDEAVKAAIELHQIRRRLDVAWAKTEQRHGAAQLRRDIAEALDGHDERQL